MKSLIFTSLLFIFSLPLFAAAPKYVFMFIGDGLGSSQREVAEYFKQKITKNSKLKLNMSSMEIVGSNTTYSKNKSITDSAAAATAIATGHKTNNKMLSKLPNGKSVKSLMEEAMSKNWATGVISSARITHATPAAFMAHNRHRDNESEIAKEISASGVNFIAGGGFCFFTPENGTFKSEREDDIDLIKTFTKKGYKVFLGTESTRSFYKFIPKKINNVFAAFTCSYMPYELDRLNKNINVPTLKEITEKGIATLLKHKKPFFMTIEGGRIDHACHLNDPAGMIHDVLAFDDAVGAALKFYKKHPNETLVLVIADHETGGLDFKSSKNKFIKIAPIINSKSSVEDTLRGVYNGDRKAYSTFIAKSNGLKILTAKEKKILNKAMDIQDKDIAKFSIGIEKMRVVKGILKTAIPKKLQYKYSSPTQVAVSSILSARARFSWSTLRHTGKNVPLTAVGVGAKSFRGLKDNTEVARILAKLLGFELTKVK